MCIRQRFTNSGPYLATKCWGQGSLGNETTSLLWKVDLARFIALTLSQVKSRFTVLRNNFRVQFEMVFRRKDRWRKLALPPFTKKKGWNDKQNQIQSTNVLEKIFALRNLKVFLLCLNKILWLSDLVQVSGVVKKITISYRRNNY